MRTVRLQDAIGAQLREQRLGGDHPAGAGQVDVVRVADLAHAPMPHERAPEREAGGEQRARVEDARVVLRYCIHDRVVDILESFVPLVGTPDEDDAIEYIYRAYCPVSFSRDILERAPQRLAAMALDGVEWSDWGRPERIETVLALRRSRALVPGRALAP